MRRARKAGKILVLRASPYLARSLQISFPIRNKDREFLEKKIFKFINKQKNTKGIGKILFIGVAPYTFHYPSLLSQDTYTIDNDKKRAVFGSPGRHIVGSALNLEKYYKDGYFDFVIANGLIGFGVNSSNDLSVLLHSIHQVMREDGVLILGYNDCKPYLDFSLATVSQFSLFTEFKPDISGMTGSSYTICDKLRHTFLFLRRN